MIEANRLSAPGERAALERVEEIAERIDQVPLESMPLPRTRMLTSQQRGDLLAELDSAAERAGRLELLEDARNRVRQAILARFGVKVYLYSGTPRRADDVSSIASAIVDAVAVAVMEDRLSPATAVALSEPGRAFLGLAPVAPSGQLPPEMPHDEPVPEPTPEDWAAATAGDAKPGDDEPIAVGLRVGLATIAAVILGPAAVFAGVAAGQTGMGILGGLAVVALCWLAATYHVGRS
jgi:hypothetical protein